MKHMKKTTIPYSPALPLVKGLGAEWVRIIPTRKATQNVSPMGGEFKVYTLLFISQYHYLVLFWALGRYVDTSNWHRYTGNIFTLLYSPCSTLCFCLFVCFSLSSAHLQIMAFTHVFPSGLNILLLPLPSHPSIFSPGQFPINIQISI